MRTLVAATIGLAFSTNAFADDLSLDVSDCVPGETLTVTVSGAAAAETIFFARGFSLGEGACPDLLGGDCMSITPTRLLVTGVADSDGVATASLSVPTSVPDGLTVYFQAVAARGADSAFSDVEMRITGEVSTTTGGTTTTTGGTTTGTGTGTVPSGLTVPDTVYGAPNRDDDNGNGNFDWFDVLDDNDQAPFTITPDPAGAARGVAFHRLTLSDPAGKTAIWVDGESSRLLTPGSGGGSGGSGCLYDFSAYGSASCDTAWEEYGIDCATLESSYYWDCTGCTCPGDGGSGGGGGATDPSSSVTLPFTTDRIDLGAEFADWRVTSVLTVEELNAAGDVLSETDIRLVSAPLLLNHHLQEAAFVVATELSGGWAGDNSEFTTPIADALGSSYGGVPGASYGNDVWIQDEFEFGSSSSPSSYQDFIIDSIRDRGLDPWAENAVFGPDFGMGVWGSGWSSTYDSFGNLEASPPVTVDGIEYPYGRIYWGVSGSDGPVAALTNFLEAQDIQNPFSLDTSWLAVGHVDEFVSFVADASSPKGFKMVWTDIDMAYEILDGMSGSTSIPRYGSGHGYSNVASLRGDTALRRYNEDIRDIYLAPIKDVLFTQLGLTEADVINIPGMFEEAYGPYGAALVPGMANLMVVDLPGEPSRIFTADPFVRSSASAPISDDPFATAFLEAMPPEHEVIFVDDWDDYHLMLGEVHCGTNVIRNQPDAWWADDAALSLLGE